MDSLIAAAASALAAGDALAALNFIALRDDPSALALRGVAMAQLDDLDRARLLLRRAAQAFGPRETVARARCVLAEAEIALVCRDLAWPAKPLDSAERALARGGDRANAAHARYLSIRRRLLLGRLDEAERLIQDFDPAPLPLASRAAYQLTVAGVAMRRLRIAAARAALAEAQAIAQSTRIPQLIAEIEQAARVLEAPAARIIMRGEARLVRLDEVESLLASSDLIVDACRRAIRCAGWMVSLETRPVLFALARTLAEAWPSPAPRATLLAKAFGAKHVDESHRARLRVEIGRLRKALREAAGVVATDQGFVLAPRATDQIAVLAPPAEEAHASVLALLADGEAWSSTALALALSASQRTVQRALDELQAAGRAQAIGRGPARRWMSPPVPGFPTALLLPVAPPLG